MSDGTGHTHRCAKIDGQWRCVPGRAIHERDTLRAQLAEAERVTKEYREALERIRDSGGPDHFGHRRIARNVLVNTVLTPAKAPSDG
jgi:hypothetical protein